jgi:hypothetical protein
MIRKSDENTALKIISILFKVLPRLHHSLKVELFNTYKVRHGRVKRGYLKDATVRSSHMGKLDVWNLDVLSSYRTSSYRTARLPYVQLGRGSG